MWPKAEWLLLYRGLSQGARVILHRWMAVIVMMEERQVSAVDDVARLVGLLAMRCRTGFALLFGVDLAIAP